MNDMALMNSSANEGAPASSCLHTRREASYCIPCAISIPDFRERAPLSYAAMPFDVGLLARAWINGRSYHLLRHPTTKVVCTSCGEEVAAAYVPEDRYIP